MDESTRFSGIGRNPCHLTFFVKATQPLLFFSGISKIISLHFLSHSLGALICSSSMINFLTLAFPFFREFIKQTIIFFFYKFQVAFFLSKLKFLQISRYFSVFSFLFCGKFYLFPLIIPGAMAPKVIIPPVAIIANVAFKTDLAVLFSEIIFLYLFYKAFVQSLKFYRFMFGHL